MESKILISKENISLRLMNNTKKDMMFLLNWLTNEQVVRWVYEEGAPWDMNKIVEQFAEKTKEGGRSIPCLIVYNKQEIGYLQYYPIEKDSYKFNSQDFYEKTAEGYGLDMFIGKPELWNKEIGTLAIGLIEDYLKNNMKAKVLCVDPITDNSRAVHFWKKVGFKPIDVIEAYDDSDQKSILMMMILDKREDIRGCVEVTINNEEMARQGIHFVCKEQRIYHISKKGTFYEIHFQTKSHPQKKIIHLLAGRGIDYIIDLQKDSPTYKKWIAFELQGNDNQHIYIPQGYGHAFLSLEDNTTQIFTVSEHFYKNESMKIRFDDQQINLSFPIDIAVMSNQDKNAPYLAEIDFEV